MPQSFPDENAYAFSAGSRSGVANFNLKTSPELPWVAFWKTFFRNCCGLAIVVLAFRIDKKAAAEAITTLAGETSLWVAWGLVIAQFLMLVIVGFVIFKLYKERRL